MPACLMASVVHVVPYHGGQVVGVPDPEGPATRLPVLRVRETRLTLPSQLFRFIQGCQFPGDFLTHALDLRPSSPAP